MNFAVVAGAKVILLFTSARVLLTFFKSILQLIKYMDITEKNFYQMMRSIKILETYLVKKLFSNGFYVKCDHVFIISGSDDIFIVNG
jgi:hypothetical protein